jgi:hypothetical protein
MRIVMTATETGSDAPASATAATSVPVMSSFLRPMSAVSCPRNSRLVMDATPRMVRRPMAEASMPRSAPRAGRWTRVMSTAARMVCSW